jgi:hypothetical protein
MPHKALLLAAAAALAAIPALTPAAAEPASAGLALQGNPAGVTKVQYYADPGYVYYYGYRPYYRSYGLLDLPGDVILGTTGLVGAAPASPWTPGDVRGLRAHVPLVQPCYGHLHNLYWRAGALPLSAGLTPPV